MRVFPIAAALAVLLTAPATLPAYAQFNLGGSGERDKTRYTEEEKRNEAVAEKAYRDTIKNTRGATNQPHDPWFNIRPGNPTAKPQK